MMLKQRGFGFRAAEVSKPRSSSPTPSSGQEGTQQHSEEQRRKQRKEELEPRAAVGGSEMEEKLSPQSWWTTLWHGVETIISF
ncbi:hypothetical protein ILYODFUR_017341 [Ilyodon furcidens]|uniref:Uncharacterized protein n=1 Tax=Ilyodon furcidens TaxID=33524 RepID=A0ABV0VFD1_9TELE